jgi:monofunctional biosynthetic peptidoglycan transglycosylase
VLRKVLRILVATGLWSVAVCVLWVLVLRVVPPPVTWLMAQQSGEQDAVNRAWVPLSSISRAMPMAVIAAEDQKFFDHHGFDVEAMRKAYAYNVRKKGRRTKGASTLSQQTAKNVFCWPGRTYVRKAAEAWFTLLIEALWSKERIIEVYLNVAETGKGRFGVEQAARDCYGHGAGRLTPDKAARIAAVLPLPRKRNACAATARSGWIVRQMGNLGDLFDPAVRERTRLEQERREERAKARTRRRRKG